MSRKWLRAVLVLFAGTLVAACSESDDSSKARLRLLNVSPDYPSVDLLLDDSTLLSGVLYESITDYQLIRSDKYEVDFKRTGISSTLYSFDATLRSDSYATYVAFGSTGAFGVIAIDEDRPDADKDETDVQVINTAVDAEPLDVYLTREDVSLDDATADFGGVGPGSSSGFKALDSGTYRMRVTLGGSKTDVRLDVGEVTLVSKGVLTVILTNTVGGTLVNAILLPQQEALTFLRNEQAQVRVAAGVAAGSTVTAKVAGIPLTVAAPANTLGNYRQLTSGAVTPDVQVDGVQVAAEEATLLAGGDYTLLVWVDQGQTRATFVTDNNRLPRPSFVKMRLINVMSGLGEPLTMAVDFYPVVEAVPLGQSAVNDEVDPLIDGQIDVIQATSGTGVHTRTSVELRPRSVYSMVMFGDLTAPVGVLRKDR